MDPEFDLDGLVRVTMGFSGSDLKEACRDAAMVPMREFIKLKRDEAGGDINKAVINNISQVRGLRTTDFFRKGGSTYMAAQTNGKVVEEL